MTISWEQYNLKPFDSSRKAFEWLSGFVNLERGQTLRSFRLDRTKALAELAGYPERCAPSFHVAGSKGKGSVTGMIAAILEASGKKTARYSSPHVSDFRERILQGDRFFTEEIYAQAGTELRELVEILPSSVHADLFDPRFEYGEAPSFFELMTLWFFLCARLSHVDVMSVETGMGGRLDATNILDPLVSVITVIELEHTEYLGKTIAAISGEKAGIIKSGKPLILAEQSAEALEVFRERAALNKSPLCYFPDCAELRDIRVSPEGTSFTLHLKNNLFGDQNFPEFFVPIPGEIQAGNAGLAILAVKTAYPHISGEQIKKGLAGFKIPARFERISTNPNFILDGAHTKRSVDLCLKTFIALYGDNGILVFGCAAGKDVLAMAQICVPHFSRIIITTPGTFKKSSPAEIFTIFDGEARKTKTKPEVFFFPETREAIHHAVQMAIEHKLPILGTGSFYLAGEIKKFGMWS